jgi:hypothetical protein
MIYTFTCKKCGDEQLSLPVDLCDSKPPCTRCGRKMARNFGADWGTLQFSTYGCKDHDDVPETKRTASNLGRGITRKEARRRERAYADGVQQKREIAEAAGGNRGSQRMAMSVPTELYHGKIKETGDKAYWKDPKNRARHRAWKVAK